jgi:AcrR family transcriptional regulator
MFNEKDNNNGEASPRQDGGRRKRGRPRGQTEQGGATRKQLYAIAVKLIASRGYEATTLRKIAKKADVSVGLLYRYFPSKRAIVLALYDELSSEYAARALEMTSGSWRTRFLFALKTSLNVLGHQRETLSALLPVLVGDESDGLFAPATGFSRDRVQSVFREAVCGALDAPRAEDDAAALGRVLYALHLVIILWWLIDKSPNQKATTELVAALERVMPAASLALKFKPARAWLQMADTVCRSGLFGEDVSRRKAHASEC